MKVEYEQIKDGIFKGYTVAYQKKYLGVFSGDAEYKRSTLAKSDFAQTFTAADKERQILQAYCFDFARQLVSFSLSEIKKDKSMQNERLFHFKVYHELLSMPKSLVESKNEMDFLIEAFEYFTIKNLESVPPENQQAYCRLTNYCHKEIKNIAFQNQKRENETCQQSSKEVVY